jgi:hypothetical protein
MTTQQQHTPPGDHPTAKAWADALGTGWVTGADEGGRLFALYFLRDEGPSILMSEAAARVLIPTLPTLAPMLNRVARMSALRQAALQIRARFSPDGVYVCVHRKLRPEPMPPLRHGQAVKLSEGHTAQFTAWERVEAG